MPRHYRKLVFSNIINIDLLIPKTISSKKDNIKANLGSNISGIGIINFKNIKNLDKNSVRANLRGGTNVIEIVNFKKIKNLVGTDID